MLTYSSVEPAVIRKTDAGACVFEPAQPVVMFDDQTLIVPPRLFHANSYKVRGGGDTKLVYEII
jgi:hypothetical protein